MLYIFYWSPGMQPSHERVDNREDQACKPLLFYDKPSCLNQLHYSVHRGIFPKMSWIECTLPIWPPAKIPGAGFSYNGA